MTDVLVAVVADLAIVVPVALAWVFAIDRQQRRRSIHEIPSAHIVRVLRRRK